MYAVSFPRFYFTWTFFMLYFVFFAWNGSLTKQNKRREENETSFQQEVGRMLKGMR